MAIRKVLFDDDPILRKKSKEVVSFDQNLKLLFEDMLETLKKEDGAGISAVQVGILKRAFIVLGNKDELVFVVNPKIISSSGSCRTKIEGCLSVPDRCGLVERPSLVVAKFQDLDGKEVERTFEGFYAKAFCHEYDHLDGILYTDKAYKMFESYDEYYKYRNQQNKNTDNK